MSRIPTFLLGAATGAAAAHLLDPDRGAGRRSAVAAQAASAARSGAATAQTQAREAAGKAKGAAKSAGPSRLEDPDDVTLARKVETEIFRAADAPKGDVSVDVQDGIVHLRGEVADEAWIVRLASEAGSVDGIKGVENRLHAPGTPAP